MANYSFALKNEKGLVKSDDFAKIFSDWKGSEERFLFVAPHDDDLCLGAGLMILSAIEAGIPVKCAITTDGSMGYGSSVPKDKIVETRYKETMDSFKILGVTDVAWLGYPDCSLNLHSGCRFAKGDEPYAIKGQVGMQNSYVSVLRDFRPTRVFVPSGNDYHPDHKMVYQELSISLFHSSGDIWPQLGEPLSATPALYEMAIYKDFLLPPDIQLTVNEELFKKKLDSIYAYASQKQIEILINNVRNAGPYEYFRDVKFDFYVSSKYKPLFD